MDRPDQYTASGSDVTGGCLANRRNDGVLLSVSYALRCPMFNVAYASTRKAVVSSKDLIIVEFATKKLSRRLYMHFVDFRLQA